MGQVVLLVVGAAWAVVLIPPLLRSRVHNRPNSSVSDFRNQLSSLQKVSRTVHMRSMGRSLVASSPQRPSASRATPADRSHTSIILHAPTGRARGGGHPVSQPSARPADRRRAPEVRVPGGVDSRRRTDSARGERAHRAHRQLLVHRRDHRAVVKRRRMSLLVVLALASVSTLVLAVATKSPVLLYAFSGVFVILAGYIYLLGQARRREDAHRQIVDVTPPHRASRHPSHQHQHPRQQHQREQHHRQQQQQHRRQQQRQQHRFDVA